MPLAVARKVAKAEIDREPEARAAVDKEFAKLSSMKHPDGKGEGVWDINSVREKADVRKEANAAGIVVFFAMIILAKSSKVDMFSLVIRSEITTLKLPSFKS